MRKINDGLDAIFGHLGLPDTAREYKPVENKQDTVMSVLKEKADLGDEEAQIELAKHYHKTSNYKNALIYYELAAKKENIEAVRRMAELYIKTKDFDNAIQCYKRLESMDNKLRSLEIGKLLLKKGDKSLALEYIRKAAESGKQEAKKILDSLNYIPDIEQLEEKAQIWKNTDAALTLADYYYDSDIRNSAYWYHFAYTHNHIRNLAPFQIKSIMWSTQYTEEMLKKEREGGFGQLVFQNEIKQLYNEIEELEHIYKEKTDSLLLIEIGDKYYSLGKNANALQKYFMAIDEGFINVYLKVARVYMTSGDFYSGMYWLLKAAQNNDLDAYYNLANIYREMGDKERELECYLKLLDEGCNYINITIANIYADELELSKAIYYYKQYIVKKDSSVTASEINNIECKIKDLEKLYALSSNPIERYEKIFNTYKKYAKKAAIWLGKAYYEGEIVEKDYQKSAFWYKNGNC